MALRWNITKITNHEEKCFHTDESGGKHLQPASDALIYACMSTGLPGITEKNWKLFFVRLRFYEKLFGTWLKAGESQVFLTAEQVKAHVGLKVNVKLETDAQWRKRMWVNFHDHIERSDRGLSAD